MKTSHWIYNRNDGSLNATRWFFFHKKKKKDLFFTFREKESEQAREGAEGKRAESQTSCLAQSPTPESDVAAQLHPMTLRSWHEAKLRVRSLTTWATQETNKMTFLNY